MNAEPARVLAPAEAGEPVVEFVAVTKTFNPGTRREFTAIRDLIFSGRRHPRIR